jgi:hypothetical protein
MPFSISSWNVGENQDWFARVEDAGTGISIKVYESLIDAQNEENLIAYALTSGFGSASVVLSAPIGQQTLSRFQTIYSWHLVVSGSSGDPLVIFKISKFVELSPISDAIYKNEDLIVARGTQEIRKRTNASYVNRLVSPVWKDIEIGNVISIDSPRISTKLAQVDQFKISGNAVSLVMEIQAIEYMEMNRS